MKGVKEVTTPYAVKKGSVEELLGITMYADPEYPYIPKPILIKESGFFESVGVEPGMQIMAVNMIPRWGMSAEEVVTIIRSAVGDVTLWIFDPPDEDCCANCCSGCTPFDF